MRLLSQRDLGKAKVHYLSSLRELLSGLTLFSSYSCSKEKNCVSKGNPCNLKKILPKSCLSVADSDQIEIQEKLLLDVEQNLKKRLELRENGFTRGGFPKKLRNLLIMILLFRNWVKKMLISVSFCNFRFGILFQNGELFMITKNLVTHQFVLVK